MPKQGLSADLVASSPAALLVGDTSFSVWLCLFIFVFFGVVIVVRPLQIPQISYGTSKAFRYLILL